MLLKIPNESSGNTEVQQIFNIKDKTTHNKCILVQTPYVIFTPFNMQNILGSNSTWGNNFSTLFNSYIFSVIENNYYALTYLFRMLFR